MLRDTGTYKSEKFRFNSALWPMAANWASSSPGMPFMADVSAIARIVDPEPMLKPRRQMDQRPRQKEKTRMREKTIKGYRLKGTRYGKGTDHTKGKRRRWKKG